MPSELRPHLLVVQPLDSKLLTMAINVLHLPLSINSLQACHVLQFLIVMAPMEFNLGEQVVIGQGFLIRTCHVGLCKHANIASHSCVKFQEVLSEGYEEECFLFFGFKRLKVIKMHMGE